MIDTSSRQFYLFSTSVKYLHTDSQHLSLQTLAKDANGHIQKTMPPHTAENTASTHSRKHCLHTRLKRREKGERFYTVINLKKRHYKQFTNDVNPRVYCLGKASGKTFKSVPRVHQPHSPTGSQMNKQGQVVLVN
jgi:hypothetical protein